MKILIISAHADDACVAIGGTIALLAENKENEIKFSTAIDIKPIRAYVELIKGEEKPK